MLVALLACNCSSRGLRVCVSCASVVCKQPCFYHQQDTPTLQRNCCKQCSWLLCCQSCSCSCHVACCHKVSFAESRTLLARMSSINLACCLQLLPSQLVQLPQCTQKQLHLHQVRPATECRRFAISGVCRGTSLITNADLAC